MEYFTIIVIAFALSLDAFSVAISCGIKLNTRQLNNYLKISFSFALFQAIMPVGGWLIGRLIGDFISSIAPWLAFSIFFFLGIKTLLDSRKQKAINHKSCNGSNYFCLISLSIATSIDAFLIGLVLSLYKTPFVISLAIIGITTFTLSLTACFIGNKVNLIMKKRAHHLAGLILLMLSIAALIHF